MIELGTELGSLPEASNSHGPLLLFSILNLFRSKWIARCRLLPVVKEVVGKSNDIILMTVLPAVDRRL